KEAQVSPGALYLYFSSKEELIAGISERDRAELAERLEDFKSTEDLLVAMAKLAEHYSLNDPQHKRVLSIEIASESTRNAAVGEIFRSVDRYVIDSFERIFAEA